MKSVILILAAIGASVCLADEPKPSILPAAAAGYHLIWNDEFDGTTLDATKWKHRQPGPRKDGVNDPAAVTLDGKGHPLITVSKVGDKYHGGMICTDGLFSTTYGYFEARVKFQTQEGWWPGFWLTSNTVNAPDAGKGTVDDTEHNGAEIDIFEYLRKNGGQIQHALHWNGYGKFHKHTGHNTIETTLTEGFHTIGCEWRPDGYTFYVDGKKGWEVSQALSHSPEYIVLSGEISSWPGDITKAQLPDSVIFDYVRVWQKAH